MNWAPRRQSYYNRLSFRLLPYFATAAGALVLAGAKPAGPQASKQGVPPKLVGFIEDLRQPDLEFVETRLDIARSLGANAIGYDTNWQEGQAEAINDVKILDMPVNEAMDRGIEPIIRYYPCFDRNPNDKIKCHYPFRPNGEKMFVTTLANLAKGLPYIRKWIIGNEPNSWRFLMPQYGKDGQPTAAATYTRVLARSYDTLKAISPDNEVYCGALYSSGDDNPKAKRPSTSVVNFILGMGVEYKKLGRTMPICDTLDIHPYGETVDEPPNIAHANKTVGFLDLAKVKVAWTEAFKGTGQPVNISYSFMEYGVDTDVSQTSKSTIYTGTSGPRVNETTQGEYYTKAIKLARCNPAVRSIMYFHLIDESDLSGWQSGVYYPDLTSKSSMTTVSSAIKSPTPC